MMSLLAEAERLQKADKQPLSERYKEEMKSLSKQQGEAT